MGTLIFEIEQQVIEAFPNVIVGGFLVNNLDKAVRELEGTCIGLEAAHHCLVQQGITIQNLADEPRIAGWRNAFKRMSLKPSTYKSSAEQLARRVFKNEKISTPLPVVNLYCAVSAKFLVPMGGYDIDRLPERRISLRFAKRESDSFSPLAGRREDMPLSPEVVVYASCDEIICWAFNYRDSRMTCLMPQTNSAVFFSEGVDVQHHEPLVNALTELHSALETHGAVVSDIYFASAKDGQAAIAIND